MTSRQKQAWTLRQERGWTLERIGRKLGIGKAAVSRLLDRAAAREGVITTARAPVLPVRTVRPISLSGVFNA